MKEPLRTLAVIHYGNYQKNGVNDDCPACGWSPPDSQDGSGKPLHPQGENEDLMDEPPVDSNPLLPGPDDPEWRLGGMWAPGFERGCGALFQIFICQSCGLVYATHVN